MLQRLLRFPVPSFFPPRRQFHAHRALAAMRVVTVPVLDDNFAYLLISEKEGVAAAVDPAEASKVLSAAQREGVKIVSVLTTHHHADHAGGNKDMTAAIAGLKVYGGDERVDAVTERVKDGDKIKVGGVQVQVHFTPCHTRGHVLYQASDDGAPSQPHALFTGDTLFVGGCGKFFEGTADQMYHALIEVISSLPASTHIYCGHEYTVNNLKFALTVEPQNKAIQNKLAWAQQLRAEKKNTVPSTIAEEMEFNPFMRVRESSVATGVGLAEKTSPIEVMRVVRQTKDGWKP